MFNKNKVGAIVFLGILGSIVIGKEKSFAAMGGRGNIPKGLNANGFYGNGSPLFQGVVKALNGTPIGITFKDSSGNKHLVKFSDADRLISPGYPGYKFLKLQRNLNHNGEVREVKLTLEPNNQNVFPSVNVDGYMVKDLDFDLNGNQSVTVTLVPVASSSNPSKKVWTRSVGKVTSTVIDLKRSSGSSQQGGGGNVDPSKLGARPKVKTQGSQPPSSTSSSTDTHQGGSRNVDPSKLGARPKIKK